MFWVACESGSVLVLSDREQITRFEIPERHQAAGAGDGREGGGEKMRFGVGQNPQILVGQFRKNPLGLFDAGLAMHRAGVRFGNMRLGRVHGRPPFTLATFPYYTLISMKSQPKTA